MLPAEYYDSCMDDILYLYGEFETSLTRDIARRIVKTGFVTDTAKNEIRIERESGALYDDVIKEISLYSGKSEKAVRGIFKDAGIESKDFDDGIYKMAGKKPTPLPKSPEMLRILDAGIKKTNGSLRNLTKTTAKTSQQAYIKACSRAELEVSSGALSYNSAIRKAVRDAVHEGTIVVYEKDGKETSRISLDAAIRRSVLTGVSQTTGEISLANAEELGTDLMEINAYGGARPEHALWQGKVVCIKGRKKGYLTLSDIGYGEITGFKGINCRHDWYPFIEGVSTRTYTESKLKKLREKTVSYMGEKIPQYEAEQAQRAMEREIRQTRRMLAGYDEAIKAAIEDDNEALAKEIRQDFIEESQNLKAQERHYKRFCKETALPIETERLQAIAFNRSVSAKAVWADRKAG